MIRKDRKSALEHFQVNAAGEYIYTGRYYSYRDQALPRRTLFFRLWVLGSLMTAAILACGCLPAPGMIDTFYVLLPFSVEIILAGCSLWALGQMSFGGDPMREYVYRDSVLKLPGRLLATAILAGVTICMELLFMLLHHTFWPMSFLVLALQGVAGILAVLGRRLAGKNRWKG